VAIQRDLPRDARKSRRERFAKERLCGGDATVTAKQEVDRRAVLVDGAVQIMPIGLDRDVRLVHPPQRADHLGETPPVSTGVEDRSASGVQC
jgi:hypothetical protein